MVLSERASGYERYIRTTPSGGSGATRERKKERCGSNLEEGRTERSRGAKEGEKRTMQGTRRGRKEDKEDSVHRKTRKRNEDEGKVLKRD